MNSFDHSKWPYSAPYSSLLPDTMPNGVSWPKISVVTPTLNQGKYIEQTILSVANQRYPNLEHIIIDGGSNDETIAIIERYRNRLAYVVSEPDRGQSHAINKGMAQATGQILTWLNSDDMLASGALAAMAIAFYISGADMVAGICQLYSGGNLVAHHLTSCPDGELPLNDLLDLEGSWYAGQFFCQPEVMFTRELWERAGSHVDESLFYSMDYELWVRFAEAGARLHVIGRPIAWYRMHPDQKTNIATNYKKELVEWRKAYLERKKSTYSGKRGPSVQKSRLRIVMLNDRGFKQGAGIAHQRLADAIAWAGHEVIAISLVEETFQPESDPPYNNEKVVDKINSCRPDLIILGNLHFAKPDPSLLSMLSERWPTLYILHDFWLLTGRCGYTSGCMKYLEGCDETCPTSKEYPYENPNRIAEAWLKKRELISNNLMLLANSNWTANFVLSALPKAPPRIDTIRLSFPLDVFKPLDKRTCRYFLGLPEDRFIILTTSEYSDKRKGLDNLLMALQQINIPDLLLVSTGHSEPNKKLLGSTDFRRMGFINDSKQMAIIYSAADLLVGPSLEETFGQIFIEAIACGTPAIGFPVSAITESVMDNVTGRLASGVDADHLAEAIIEMYNNPGLRQSMSSWGRLYVENEWSPFQSYRSLFLALGRFGLLETMQCSPKITFQPVYNAPTEALPLSRVTSSKVLSLVQTFEVKLIRMCVTAIMRLIYAKGHRLAEAKNIGEAAIRIVKESVKKLKQ